MTQEIAQQMYHIQQVFSIKNDWYGLKLFLFYRQFVDWTLNSLMIIRK
jgi:hypothetical protein